MGISWETWTEHVVPTVRIVRLGRRKLVSVAELESWLEANAQTTLRTHDTHASGGAE